MHLHRYQNHVGKCSVMSHPYFLQACIHREIGRVAAFVERRDVTPRSQQSHRPMSAMRSCTTHQQWLSLYRRERGQVGQACQGPLRLCCPRDNGILEGLVESVPRTCIQQLILAPSKGSQQVRPCGVCWNKSRALEGRVTQSAASDRGVGGQLVASWRDGTWSETLTRTHEYVHCARRGVHDRPGLLAHHYEHCSGLPAAPRWPTHLRTPSSCIADV